MADLMREQFEAAYATESTIRNGRFYPEVLTRGDDGDYIIPSVQSAWWGWRASREAVVVDLPPLGSVAASDSPWEILDACQYAIEVQGLRVSL